MKAGAPGTFGAQLKALREAASFTQEELATIAGLSAHAISALERGERRRPHVETVRALSAALDLTGPAREAFLGSARAVAPSTASDQFSDTLLPLPLTLLIGREAEIEALRQWLADPVVRLITLIGPGGVGKTRLVLELARAVVEEGSVRVRFVSLAPLRDPAFVAPAIAEALGLSDVTALDLPKRARAACADQPTLLVLDNFEHLLDAAPLVADLLASVLSLRLLVTSRAPLHLRGEREYLVGPLASQTAWDATSPDDLARVPAVRLFVERVRNVHPDFRLTPANGPTVAAICRRLDALPLALELAAPWVKVLPLEDLLNRLERDNLPVTVGVRDLPERQQTMNATVAWSYQLLGPEEQRAFRRLGILPGLFPIDVATAILAGDEEAGHGGVDVLRLVGALIDKSLLQQSERSVVTTRPLYLMLDTMRAYATHQLDATGERDEALERLARYCAGEASRAAMGLGPRQVQWLDRVREDLESYRVVLTWLIERGRLTEAGHIAWALVWFWVIRGHTVEGLHWYEELLKRPSLPPGVESRALLGSACMQYWQGDLDRARSNLSRALALSQGLDDRDAAVFAEYALGYVEVTAGNLDAARDWLTRCLKGFRALASPFGPGQALTGLAWVALAAGNKDEAERLLDEATAELRDGGPWFLSPVEYLRAILAVRRGHQDDALALIRDNLIRIRDLKDQSSFVYTMAPLAAAAALKGDYAWVARIVGARDAVTDRTGAIDVAETARDLRESAERDARAHLGAERWARAYAAGRESSIEALIQDIDRRTHHPSAPRRQ
jgi:predicted ATPase/DNA-binding XRE family transcriptional regulator